MIWETISSWDASTVAEVVGATVALVGAVVGAAMWILRWFGRRRTQRLLEKRVGSQLYPASVLEQSTRYYVEPDCSIVDPAREEEIRNIRAPKENAFDALDDFFDKDSVYRHMIILADSGMGKTSLLLNYFVRNYKRRNPKKIKLLPLGIPNLEKLIKEIEDPEHTTIFLDAFDEDTKAIADHKDRLHELMNICRSFDRVVITCRTQFFLDDEEIPKETGVLSIGPRSGGEGAVCTFQKLYLMPLTDEQVRQYLRKRYSVWRINKRKEAQKIVEKIPLLSVRPMLLSHIPELLDQETKIEYSYELYEVMVQAWLQREKGWVEPDTLRAFSERLAYDLFINRKERGAERLPREELNSLIIEWGVPLDSQQASGHSLLNRDADGNLKFAHRSIMEYLFLCCDISKLEQDWGNVEITDQMIAFTNEMIQNHEFSMLKNLRGADLSNADLRGANWTNADLRGADLSNADLSRAIYNSGTNWPDGFDYRNSGAIGPNANLLGADLSGTDLRGGDLRGANLRGTVLSDANLRGADLSDANLRYADLRGADLSDTDLSDADLRYTDLRDVFLFGARYNETTKWPEGFDYQRSGAVSLDS